MELFSFEFFSALLTIVFIDLILAGDNAIVIGLAARKLPKDQQTKAVIWGTVGAVVIRAVATLLVVYLLDIPWLMLAGGILLLWIAYKLLVDQNDHDIKAGNTLWQSVWTIIIADAAMGVDNVIAVAGAAHGHVLLVIIGLLISIPIVVWGSTLFLKIINRLPWIVYVGSGVLAYTAAKMITHEERLEGIFASNPLFKWSFMIVVVITIILAGLWKNNTRSKQGATEKSRESH
ncbi:membrane protein [Paenibacillus baekrokdamisoli]|uniref:Membrane protein n=1 Tax=Paenibacillus baekrokdamisoli TaxID=1712516 RepID=A0A3G9JDL7_9BACL|nr:TerC family protein [Paenibacillus baekrokdamisoli]MBB3070249.1 YjbE family integral membrane protein [Paenibacillus baekrokdamisoli]BBH21254.1 membrane protein [Paenibacillus baekrokdamisoli]